MNDILALLNVLIYSRVKVRNRNFIKTQLCDFLRFAMLLNSINDLLQNLGLSSHYFMNKKLTNIIVFLIIM